MTAEIAVLNRFGVALAADSAVTIGSGKIFNSAEKLFALSRTQPVGFMVYGNAYFMNIPWETVLKVYRNDLGSQSFAKLKDYSNHFLEYIKSEPRFTSPDSEKQKIGMIFSDWLEGFLSQLNQYINNTYSHSPDEEELQRVMLIASQEAINQLNGIDFTEGFTQEFFDVFNESYRSYIITIFADNVNFDITDEIVENLVYIASSLVCSDIYSDGNSGIVIAGFGEDDLFPALYSYQVEGIFNGVLKYKESNRAEIGAYNNAQIVPFAQQEMVHAFLTGIDPTLDQEIHQFLDETVNIYPAFIETLIQDIPEEKRSELINQIFEKGQTLLLEFQKTLQQTRRKKYINPIVQTVASFPKEELAAMAEALVNLTSIKRKVSNQAETVGGPTDVAVISKKDGFIWIKRKHYFSKDLNYQYFNNLT